MNFLSFDLELNQDPTGAKIIEIGACIGDTKTREIIAQYSAFVDPHEILQEHIIKLTGITQSDVDNAGTLLEAYVGMCKMAELHECARMPVVWGCGDGHALRQELPKDTKWLFGRRELDVKALYQSYQVAVEGKLQAGLAKAMTKLGLQFAGKKHRAVDDAINTFLIFCELIGRFQS